MSKTTSTEHKIEEFAEDLGRLLGHARKKAEGWLDQRQAIAKHLEDIRDTATNLLGQLGHQAQKAVRRGRPAASRNDAAGEHQPLPITVKRRRKMSAAARKKISDAQKRRWAAQKAKKG